MILEKLTRELELLRLDAEKVAGTHLEAIGERPPERGRSGFPVR